MTVKRILVPILGTDRDRPALRTALAVARLFGSHVEALYRCSRHDQDAYISNLPAARFETFRRELEKVSWAQGEQRDTEQWRLFEDVLDQEGVAYAEASHAGGLPSASWRAVAEPVTEAVAYYGAVADLVVVGRPGSEPENIEQIIAEAALFGSACPVLVAPPGGVDKLGQRTLIGWNRIIPAERAVACARPFLERAEKVVVLSVATEAKQRPSPHEVAEHLALHGIPARVREILPDHRGVGPALLDEARAMDADLMVMGASSHSRWRMLLLGGITRYILGHAELPVLMAR